MAEPWEERARWIAATFYDGNTSAMGRDLGLSRETARKWTGGTKAGLEELAAILRRHPTISPTWLLLGTGPRTLEGGGGVRGVAWDVLGELRRIERDLVQRYGEPSTSGGEGGSGGEPDQHGPDPDPPFQEKAG